MNNLPTKTKAVEVLQCRKTVCAGYADLFKALATSVNLICEYITGKAVNAPERVRDTSILLVF
jgi:transglutaminase/protease-like cytokinesis protein 3